MSRFPAIFQTCRAAGRKALIAFASAGAPDMESSEKAMGVMLENGADILEIGVPFSDPTADGTVIQKASQIALQSDVTLHDVLALAERLRRRFPDKGLVIFSYYNVIFRMGADDFARRAAAAGVDGVLVVDLPFEESAELRPALEQHGLDRITLVSPLTGPERLQTLLADAKGFVYYIMQLGVTGVRKSIPDGAAEKLDALRAVSPVPVAAGFGIGSYETARAAACHADGVISGSALVRLQLQSDFPGIARLTRELARGCTPHEP